MSEAAEQKSEQAAVREARLWKADGWTARVLKNEDDDGWAVAMTRDGDPEPALVGPWTMGRDKKNPKPLDNTAFLTLVKTAREVLERHASQRRAQLHKSAEVDGPEGSRVRVEFDVVPDEEDPHAFLSAFDAGGGLLLKARVEAGFRFTHESATRWAQKSLG